VGIATDFFSFHSALGLESVGFPAGTVPMRFDALRNLYKAELPISSPGALVPIEALADERPARHRVQNLLVAQQEIARQVAELQYWHDKYMREHQHQQSDPPLQLTGGDRQGRYPPVKLQYRDHPNYTNTNRTMTKRRSTLGKQPPSLSTLVGKKKTRWHPHLPESIDSPQKARVPEASRRKNSFPVKKGKWK